MRGRRRGNGTPKTAARQSPRDRFPRIRAVAIGAAALAVVAAGIWWWLRGPAFALHPTPDQNVLLVTIDTLRSDALSCYGGPADTPNLDRLAAHGARFTFAHSHAVVTLVSHTTLLSGQYPYTHGVRDNSGYRVPPGTSTVATRLKAMGFATGAFVGGFPLVRRFGLAPGFDVYDDQIGEMQGSVDFSLPERRADVVVGRALEWMNRQTSRFFAWVHVFDPHAPYRPPDEWLARYSAQPYYGEVAWTDHALGPLLERLKTLPRQTLVIVTADHGEGLGEHGEATHGMFAYESTLHVPLVIAEVAGTATSRADARGLSRADARGVVIDAPVRHIDILPTILDSLSAGTDPSLPGSSLRELVHSGRGNDRPSYFEAMTGNVTRDSAPLRGVLVGGDKYIDLPIRELYDVLQDPHELRNLAPGQTSRTEVLLNTLGTYNIALPGRPTLETTEVAAQLRALGYVSGVPVRERHMYTDADDPKELVGLDQDLHHATDAYERGQYDDAIAAFQRVLARRPETGVAYKYLAYVYWQIGQPEAAMKTLDLALQRGVKDHDVPLRLGVYLAETGQAARAIALLQTLSADDEEVLNGLGMAYGQAGKDADALRTFARALALDPTDGLAYQNIATVQLRAALAARQPADRAARLKEAERSARESLEVDPRLASAHTTLGVILSKTGRMAEAVEHWKQAVELDRTEYDALYNLVIQLAATGLRDEARRYGQRFLDTAPPAFYRQDLEDIRRLLGGGNMTP